jgi:cell division control protein 7
VTNVPTVEHPRFPDLHRLVKTLNPAIVEENKPAHAAASSADGDGGDGDDEEWYNEGCELWQAVDLLKQTLALDCTKRITARDALDHPFLSGDWDIGHCSPECFE